MEPAVDPVQVLQHVYRALQVTKAQDLGTTQEARAQEVATATGRLGDGQERSGHAQRMGRGPWCGVLSITRCRDAECADD